MFNLYKSHLTCLLFIMIFLNCASTKKKYSPTLYHKPIMTRNLRINFNRAEYVQNKNNREYIIYKKGYTNVRYYSNIDKKTNRIVLQTNECIYDSFIVKGASLFQNDIINSLFLLEQKCTEEFATIRNGIIDNEQKYHKGISLISQGKNQVSEAIKANNSILIGKMILDIKRNNDYYKVLSSLIIREGYRLIYWDEWGPLPVWWYRKEGIKLQIQVLKKLNASPGVIRKYEKSLDDADEQYFYRKLYEDD